MSEELNFNEIRKINEINNCLNFLKSFGGKLPKNNIISNSHDIYNILNKMELQNFNSNSNNNNNNNNKLIPIYLIKLISEILNKELNEKEYNNCINYCKTNDNKNISMNKFVEWWVKFAKENN